MKIGIGTIVLSCVMIVCITVLAALDKDVSSIIQFALAMLPVIAGLVVQSMQLDRLDKRTEGIERNVNGNLQKQFDNLHSKLDTITDPPEGNPNG